VEESGPVADLLEQAPQREVERAAPAAHAVRVGNPVTDQGEVPVGELPDGELTGQSAVFEQGKEEVGGRALDVVHAQALQVQRASQPVGGVHEAAGDVAVRPAVDRGEVAAEAEVLEDV